MWHNLSMENNTAVYNGIKLNILKSKFVAESGNTVYTVQRPNGKRLYALFADARGTFFNLTPIGGKC